MADTVTIDLEFPVTVKLSGGNKERDASVSTVELRRPKVKDLKGINLEKLEGDALVLLVMRLADLDRQVVNEIDVADFLKMSEAIGGFFPQPSEDKKIET